MRHRDRWGGDESSNSVASVANRRTGEKVAEFTTSQMSPTEFARHVVALCRWFHGAFLIWEDNGPGGEFGKEVRDLGYRNVFYREGEKSFDRKKTGTAGWWSGKEEKAATAGRLRLCFDGTPLHQPQRRGVARVPLSTSGDRMAKLFTTGQNKKNPMR